MSHCTKLYLVQIMALRRFGTKPWPEYRFTGFRVYAWTSETYIHIYTHIYIYTYIYIYIHTYTYAIELGSHRLENDCQSFNVSAADMNKFKHKRHDRINRAHVPNLVKNQNKIPTKFIYHNIVLSRVIPGEAYMSQWTKFHLVQMMAWRLFGAKPRP